VVIRQEKTPAANNRFGPGSAALRATPLERPSARLSQRETSDKITVTAPEPLQEETRVSYQQYMANQRRMRSRLSTGDDRR
jgi:hypothetical protein